VAIERARAEQLAEKQAWDVAVSRATLPPPEWLALAATMAAPGGDVWVLLANEAPPEYAGATGEDDVSYVWPLTGAARRAVRYRVST
jgi:16S rRNA (guanine527-N7)-methyltransferase